MNRCFYHSSKEAVYRCEECGKEICQHCVIVVESEPFCQVCWESFIAKNKARVEELQPEIEKIPWQRRDETGIVNAFVETISMVFFQPAKFFSLLPSKSSLGSPLLFALLCVLLFWFPVNLFYIKLVFPSIVERHQSEQGNAIADSMLYPPIDEYVEWMDIIANQPVQSLWILPFNYFLFNVLLVSFIQQLLLNLFQENQGFISTLQIRCYSMAVQCLYLIPLLGIVLAEILILLLGVRGFQVAQNLSRSRAFLVASVPLLFYVATSL